jgi:parallel beta-helix repeat protein
MKKPFFNPLIVAAVVAATLCVLTARTQAAAISGTISTTLNISEDSELAGDVVCMVANAPCISFGASHIKLKLNGFTMTDGLNTSSCISSSFPEDAILVNGQQDVAILGPGLIRRFAGLGISLIASSKVTVEGVTASDNCFSGIFLAGTSDSDIEKNISVRNSIGSQGFPCGGT